MRNDTVSAKEIIARKKDDEFWTPITEEEHDYYQKLIDKVRTTLEKGSKKQKGDALENLMTYVYGRFQIAFVEENLRKGDNQIDHVIRFIDGISPDFVSECVGTRMIGESKNHKKAVSVREVADLVELLRSKKAKIGLFTSSKTFSRGRNKNPWVHAEGKRRKLAIAYNNERIILGFTIDELELLKENNFYSMLKTKYYSLVDEIDDDVTDYHTDDLTEPYPVRLFHSLNQLKENKIIDEHAFEIALDNLENRYGKL
ncbi:hypothetical protein [Exiguobacterium sp. USCH10]|jgi:hypothetical protein|uniref:hypothetical protein n=1 Tax=Exiguobacterium sp. USCH10 TaxID=3024839 RepID=UPI0030AB9251